MRADSFHVSVNTKMSSAPMQRMRKRPSSSKMLTVRWPHSIQRNMARGIETMISKRPERVSSSDVVLSRIITKMSRREMARG